MRKLNLLVLGLLLLSFASARSQVQVEWIATYDGDNLEGQYDYDYVTSMAVDSAGRLHVTGNVYGSNGTPNILTIQYRPDGQPNWIASYDAARNQDYSDALVLDDDGNVYVAGSSATFVAGDDLVVLKYDSSGHLLWVARYNGPGNTSDTAEALRVDKAGNVYVTGYSYNAQNNFDAVTIKYDAKGNELWVARYDGPGHDEDRGQDLILDASGNVYVTGFATTDCFLDPTGDILCRYAGLTIKYSPAGEQLWADLYSTGTNEFRNLFNAIALNSAAEPIVTGMALASIGFDTVTIKYNAQGRREWVAREPDSSGLGGGWDIATDRADNVVVLTLGMQTCKYDSRGRLLWSAQEQGIGASLAVDEAGGIYIAGTAWNEAGTHPDAVAAKYDSLGTAVWSFRYTNAPMTYDASSGIALDNERNVYIGGQTETPGVFGRDFLAIKLTQQDVPLLPLVSIRADRNKAFEGPNHRNPPGRFTVTRAGDTTAPLTVFFVPGGTAEHEVDYEWLGPVVTIPAGESEVSLLIQPIDDLIREGSEFVRLSLIPSPDYRLGQPQHATVTIVDDDRK